MKLRQLMEGQKEQIEGLRKRSPLSLYMPIGIDDVRDMEHDTGNLTKEPRLVTPSLKSAVPLSNIVMQFYGLGQYLQPPREMLRSRGDKHWAAQKFPDSFDPLISFALTSQNPKAYYTGPITVSRAEKVFVMQNGKPVAMDPEQFSEWMIKYIANDRRRKQRRVDVQYT